jgi:hypothetical protein
VAACGAVLRHWSSWRCSSALVFLALFYGTLGSMFFQALL